MAPLWRLGARSGGWVRALEVIHWDMIAKLTPVMAGGGRAAAWQAQA